MQATPALDLRNSITTKMLLVVFSIYFGITLTVTLIHMVAEYFHAKQNVQADLQGFEATFRPGLAQALWDFNQDQLQSTLKGIQELPIIVGTKIENLAGQEIAATGIILRDGKITAVNAAQTIQNSSPLVFNDLFSHSFPITYIDENGGATLQGRGFFYSNVDIVWQKVQYGFLFIVINSIIKTVALWVIFLWVGRQMLSKPLAILTQFAAETTLDKLEQLKIDTKAMEHTELKILERAFNAMLHKLSMEKGRMISLRRYVNKINHFKNLGHAFQFAYEELLEHVPAEQYALYALEPNGEYLLVQSHPTPSSALHLPLPPPAMLPRIFSAGTQHVAVLNHLHSGAGVWPAEQKNQELIEGSHFVFIHLDDTYGQIIRLWRPAAAALFDSAESEYIKNLLNEAEITRKNFSMFQANIRMESELKTASAVQQAIYPQYLPISPVLDFSMHYSSATETCGDWHGFMTNIPNKIFVLIGDVTGHGSPAALVTAVAGATLWMLEEFYLLHEQLMRIPLSPANILKFMNKAVFKAGNAHFLMTMFVAEIDLQRGTLSYANAGHNFPFLLRENGEMNNLLNSNTMLGRDAGVVFTENSMQLKAGDKIIFYTDGLTENYNPNFEMWGERRFARTLKAQRSLPIQPMMDQVLETANTFYQGCPFADDITLLGVEVKAPFPQA